MANMEREMGKQSQIEWDALPYSALVNVFCKTSIKDRIFSNPLVCKSWSNASSHPQCWASMVAESYYSTSPNEDAFLKDSYPYHLSFVDPFDGKRCSDPDLGVQALTALIGRAAGGALLTSLYIFPFLSSGLGSPPNDDALLHLISQHCPNLKHLSFHGSNSASEEAIFEVLQNCTQLGIVDFSDSPYFVPSVLEKLSVCCPNIRGIRRNGDIQLSFASDFSKFFPSLRLLNLSDSTLVDADLLTLVTNSQRLVYLDIRRCQQLIYYMYIIKGASATNVEIIYD